MAIVKRSAGKELPLSQAVTRIKGRLILYQKNGRIFAQSWPRKRTRPPTDAELLQRQEFAKLAQATKEVIAEEALTARLVAEGSKYTWRDILARAMVGRLAEFPNYGEIVSQYNLDILGDQPGMIVIRTMDAWIALPIGDDAEILTIVNGLPAWEPLQAITQLHGDISAGPGTGNQLATLPTTGVTPGSYTHTSLTVDAKGRITGASNGTVPAAINQLTGDVTAGPGGGSQVATLSNTGVTAGSYTVSSITVNAKGRVTSASSGTIPAAINQLTGDVTAGPGGGSQAATLSATGVAPGSYPLASITVDAKGRLSSATAGSAAGANTIAHPGFTSGRYYTALVSGALSNAIGSANTLYCVPFFVGTTTTFTKMAGFVASNAAVNLEFGVYDNVNGLPVNLVHDCGSVAVGAGTGRREITGRTITLSPGWYFLAIGLSGSINLRTTPSSSSAQLWNLGTQDTLVNVDAIQAYSAAWTFSAGALPSIFPAAVAQHGAMPLAFIGL
jgi:hypothetical protein